MGLDTSHDCWHGPYGQFMRWRTWLAAQIGLPLGLMKHFYEWEWEKGDLDFHLHYSGITKTAHHHTVGQMWWSTLRDFSSLGCGIAWPSSRQEPLVWLLDHSDSNGRIKWFHARPIAIRLGQIIRSVADDFTAPIGEHDGKPIWDHWRNGRGCYDGMIPATKRFAVGLLNAFKQREDVRFG